MATPNTKSATGFLSKTYELVDNPATDRLICWCPRGTSFIVHEPEQLADDVLPRYFKHSNFSSFVRQLNTYGFRKIAARHWQFANEKFLKGHPELLSLIQRRKPGCGGAPDLDALTAHVRNTDINALGNPSNPSWNSSPTSSQTPTNGVATYDSLAQQCLASISCAAVTSQLLQSSLAQPQPPVAQPALDLSMLASLLAGTCSDTAAAAAAAPVSSFLQLPAPAFACPSFGTAGSAFQPYLRPSMPFASTQPPLTATLAALLAGALPQQPAPAGSQLPCNPNGMLQSYLHSLPACSAEPIVAMPQPAAEQCWSDHDGEDDAADAASDMQNVFDEEFPAEDDDAESAEQQPAASLTTSAAVSPEPHSDAATPPAPATKKRSAFAEPAYVEEQMPLKKRRYMIAACSDESGSDNSSAGAIPARAAAPLDLPVATAVVPGKQATPMQTDTESDSEHDSGSWAAKVGKMTCGTESSPETMRHRSISSSMCNWRPNACIAAL